MRARKSMAARKEGVGGEAEGDEVGAATSAAASAVVDDAAARAQDRNWRADGAAVEAPPSHCVSCWPRTTGPELAPALTDRATAAATARIIGVDLAVVVVVAVAAGVCLLDRQPLTGERGLFVVPRPLLLQQGGPVAEAGAAPRICRLRGGEIGGGRGRGDGRGEHAGAWKVNSF